MIKSITNFLIIFFIFQQLKFQISQIDQNGVKPFCDETLHMNYVETCTKIALFVTVEQLSTSKISSTCPTGVNYISKYAGDLREKNHEVWTWNSNWSRCTAKKTTGGGGAEKAPPPPPPLGLGLRNRSNHSNYQLSPQLIAGVLLSFIKRAVWRFMTLSLKWTTPSHFCCIRINQCFDPLDDLKCNTTELMYVTV